MPKQTIIIGDVHGCYDELRDLLDRAAVAVDDRVVAVGDLIVKGPRNKAVLDLFIGDARFSSVIGNHDLAVRRGWGEKKNGRPKLKPAQEQARSELDVDRQRYASYLDALPFVIELEQHVVVHAGVRPGVRLAEQAPEDLTELRTLGPDRTSRDGMPWYEAYRGEKTVLFGHWPAPTPRRGPRALGLDTGCVYGETLTAYVIESDKFLSVRARRVYQKG